MSSTETKVGRGRRYEPIRLLDQQDAFDWAVTEAGRGLPGIVCGLDGRPARYASKAEADTAAARATGEAA